jgi:hypothetical protein
MTRRLTAVWTAADQPGIALAAFAQAPKEWEIHDMTRPRPRAVDPGTASTPDQPGRPPADAVVLFDGKDLSKWVADKGGPAGWKVAGGFMEVVKGTGSIHTVQGFGDVQLHVEWQAPSPAVGEGQDRGNSGVFLMGMYEVQVLDSYQADTYADGQAAALYGQYPPLVNATRPPGQWQTYHIIFHRPRFDSDGKLLRPATATVIHNGVLVQDNQELTGPTAHKARPPYKAHADKLPLGLQDHAAVRYRSIWVRGWKGIEAEPSTGGEASDDAPVSPRHRRAHPAPALGRGCRCAPSPRRPATRRVSSRSSKRTGRALPGFLEDRGALGSHWASSSPPRRRAKKRSSFASGIAAAWTAPGPTPTSRRSEPWPAAAASSPSS